MMQILTEKRFDPFPTAVFCGNDAVALGCMEVLAENQIRVPEEVSVAGFDDTLTARITTPQLTTIRQPFRQMGRRAVEALLPQINDSRGSRKKDAIQQIEQEESAAVISAEHARKQPHTEVFDVELVVRGSVGPPPAHPLILK
jgi:DNA-binding LacI/PurR family transcriptional regulator